MRLIDLAWKRKKGGLKEMTWQQIIDSHVDDEHNLLLRDLLADATDGRKKGGEKPKETQPQAKSKKPTGKKGPKEKSGPESEKEPKEKVVKPPVEKKPVKKMGDIVREWCDATGMDPATFYRRKAELESWSCLQRPEKIKLSHSTPPVEERPKDEYLPDLDEDEAEKEE